MQSCKFLQKQTRDTPTPGGGDGAVQEDSKYLQSVCSSRVPVQGNGEDRVCGQGGGRAQAGSQEDAVGQE